MLPVELEILKIANRDRYVRSNFAAAEIGGSDQYIRRACGWLCSKTLLRKPKAQLRQLMPLNKYRIYELTNNGAAELAQRGIEVNHWGNGQDTTESHTGEFWHRVMVATLTSSIITAAKQRGIRYEHKWQLLRGKPLTIEVKLEWDGKRVAINYEPDDVLRLGDIFIIREDDRTTEPLTRQDLKASSIRKKLLCQREIINQKLAQKVWGFGDTPYFLYTTIGGQERIEGFKNTLRQLASSHNPKSYRLAFISKPQLALDLNPKPLLSLLDDQWDRVGYPPLVIRNELPIGHEKTT